MVQETEMDRTVWHQKHQQRSSISILRISQQQRLVVQLTEIVGCGSAALIATTATISAVSTRADPTTPMRTPGLTSLSRSAFTDIFIPFYDRVCLK